MAAAERDRQRGPAPGTDHGSEHSAGPEAGRRDGTPTRSKPPTLTSSMPSTARRRQRVNRARERYFAACHAYAVDGGTKMRLTLETRSPAQLVRATLDARIRFREVEDNDELVVRIFHEVRDLHLWSAQSWASCGSPPANRHWLIDVDDEPAGLLTLLCEPDGDVEIVSFRPGARQAGTRTPRVGAHDGGRPRLEHLR